jgi:hypothetical protein
MIDRKRLLRRLWAIADSLFGKEKEEKVYSYVSFVYEKERLRELTDEELEEMVKAFVEMLSEKECPSAPHEWRLIKVLQKKLGWTNEHLLNYIKKYARVDHPRFLTQYEARIVITAMMTILNGKKKRRKDRSVQIEKVVYSSRNSGIFSGK